MTKLVPLNVVESCMTGAECGATGHGTRIYPNCLYWLFENLFSLDGYLAQSRYSREESLVPSPIQCALPYLKSDNGREEYVEVMGGEERVRTGLVCIMKKDCFLFKK